MHSNLLILVFLECGPENNRRTIDNKIQLVFSENCILIIEIEHFSIYLFNVHYFIID